MHNEVTLEEMLAAREERARYQQELLLQYQQTLICLTLNIAGPVKVSPLILQTFVEGQNLIARQLARHHVAVLYTDEKRARTGYEGYWIANAAPGQIKRWMMEIEEDGPFGRLLDIDVLDPAGNKIDRQEVGAPGRTCLLCDQPAPVCASSRRHSVEELGRRTTAIMQEYFAEQFAHSVSYAATRALLYEAAVTPKPGLVDRHNTGSHEDMDIFTLTDSALVLAPYFHAFTRIGMQFQGTPQELFAAIHYKGQQAEDAMYSITGGVNTHKGGIFSIGLICAATGFLHANHQTADTDAILDLCAEMTKGILDHFTGVTLQNAKTYGEKLYARYGITGIRGEAAAGFPSIRRYALPVLRSLISDGVSLNDAGVIVLLQLLIHATDTNIIARSNLEMLEQVQQRVKDLFKEKNRSVTSLIESAEQLDHFFIQQHISAGGCADLLAVSFLLLFLETTSQDNCTHTTAEETMCTLK